MWHSQTVSGSKMFLESFLNRITWVKPIVVLKLITGTWGACAAGAPARRALLAEGRSCGEISQYWFPCELMCHHLANGLWNYWKLQNYININLSYSKYFNCFHDIFLIFDYLFVRVGNNTMWMLTDYCNIYSDMWHVWRNYEITNVIHVIERDSWIG